MQPFHYVSTYSRLVIYLTCKILPATVGKRQPYFRLWMCNIVLIL